MRHVSLRNDLVVYIEFLDMGWCRGKSGKSGKDQIQTDPFRTVFGKCVAIVGSGVAAFAANPAGRG
ncbi:MAG: hypothetical protein P1P74_05145 [Desulfuromonadales bacterium]|nr:hypothetical protein [Desulfuromonadales bacterium]